MTTHKFFTVEIAFCPNNLNAKSIHDTLYNELAIETNVINWDEKDKSEEV